MLRTVCKILSAVLALSMLMTCLCGCGEEKPVVVEGGGNAVRSELSDLFPQGLLVENNITLEYVDEDDYRSYIIIDGLKNTEVEQKINDRIMEMFNELSDPELLPPYRGAKLRLEKYKKDHEEYDKRQYVSFELFFNCNGLLSIGCYGSITYENDFDYLEFQVIEPLNFDLATGDEIALADLFATDTEYLEVLDRAVDRELMKKGFDSGRENSGEYVEIGELCLTAPFKGLKPEQKFLISDFGKIDLIMDYDTPEFYNESNRPITFAVSVVPAPVLSSSQRNMDLFEDDTPVYNICGSRLVSEKDIEFISEETPRENMIVYYNYYLNSDLSDELSAEIESKMRDIYGRDIDVETLYRNSKALADFGHDWEVSCNDHCNVLRCGDFTCAMCELYVNAYGGVDFNDICSIYYTYRGDDTTPMQLEDIFVQPENARALIAQAFAKKIAADYGDEESAQKLALEMAAAINGFMLDENAVLFSSSLTYNEFLELGAKYYGEESSVAAYDCRMLMYREIGCENLNIFGDGYSGN